MPNNYRPFCELLAICGERHLAIIDPIIFWWSVVGGHKHQTCLWYHFPLFHTCQQLVAGLAASRSWQLTPPRKVEETFWRHPLVSSSQSIDLSAWIGITLCFLLFRQEDTVSYTNCQHLQIIYGLLNFVHHDTDFFARYASIFFASQGSTNSYSHVLQTARTFANWTFKEKVT